MAFKAVLSIALLFVAMIGSASGAIWIIRHRSHPYKTEIYTAEFVSSSRVYYWCADHIRLQDAVVLCNQVSQYSGLGPYDVSSARVEFGALRHDPAVLEAFTNETFACVGNESRLSDCPRRFVTDRCPSGNVGQVDCNPADNSRKNLTTSLIDMVNIAGIGVVEVENASLSGMAGLVCIEDGFWGQNEASVVCRSLGFDHGWPVRVPITEGVSSSHDKEFVIKNVRCQGTEASINDCPHTDMCMAMDYLSRTFLCPNHCDGEMAGVACR